MAFPTKSSENVRNTRSIRQCCPGFFNAVDLTHRYEHISRDIHKSITTVMIDKILPNNLNLSWDFIHKRRIR